LPADQRWALLRRCLTDAQLSTPLRVAGSPVLLYGQTPTRNRHVDPTRRHAPRRHDLHHLASTAGVDALSVGRPDRPARPVQHRAPATARDPAEPVHPGYSPAHDLAHTKRAGYLGTSLNEQLGLQIRPGRGAALRPSRRTGRCSTGRTARHLSRHRQPVGRTRQTRLDRLQRRTGRTTLGTPADVTNTDGTAPLLSVASSGGRHKSPKLDAPVTAPSPDTFAGGCYGNLRGKFDGHLRRGPTSPLKVRLTVLADCASGPAQPESEGRASGRHKSPNFAWLLVRAMC